MQKITATTTIELDTAEIATLFEKEYDGWCPVCKHVQINEGETICCDCLREALGYHTNTCGCQP